MPAFQMANAGLLRDLQPNPYDPAQGMQQAAAIQKQMEAQREQQAAKQREAMIAEVVQQFPNDPDKAIGVLRTRDWKAAGMVEEALGKNRKALADRRKVEIENQLSQMTVDRGGLSAKDALEAELAAVTRGQVEDWARFESTNAPEAKKAAMVLMGPEKWAEMQDRIRQRAETERSNLARETGDIAQLTETKRSNLADESTARGNLGVAQGNLAVSRGNLDQRIKEGAATGGAGGAKLGVAAIEKIAGVDQARGMMDDIERLLPKMGSHIGMIDGRMTKARIATGKGLTPELAEFDAQITGLKNAVIKATTGAAMSEPEAQRIMGQIPDLTNNESVFKARLATTRKNLELLKKRTIELSGGTVDTPAAGAGPKPTGRFNPATGKVEPVQ